jgi:hypothetical protein
MIRIYVHEAATLAALALFVACIAVWAQIIPALW